MEMFFDKKYLELKDDQLERNNIKLDISKNPKKDIRDIT